MARRCHGSRPTTRGCAVLSACSNTAALALLQVSPHPTRPSSVVSFRSTIETPPRSSRELTSRHRYLTLTIVVSKLAIFMCRSLEPFSVREDAYPPHRQIAPAIHRYGGRRRWLPSSTGL